MGLLHQKRHVQMQMHVSAVWQTIETCPWHHCQLRNVLLVPMTFHHRQEVHHHPTDRFAASVPAVALLPETLFLGMPLYLGDLPLTMGKVILTTDKQHMEAICAAQGNSWRLVTHMNEVSLGDAVRVRVCPWVWMCAPLECVWCVRRGLLLFSFWQLNHRTHPFPLCNIRR